MVRPDRRERKKAATRVTLREAALRMAARHGVENVTVEQIATEADIAVRTFFNYFSSKEEAMVGPLTAGAEALIAEFRARPRTESVLEALREATLAVLHTRDTADDGRVDALRLIMQAPSLVPQRLAVFAAKEKALAAAIAERVRLSPRQPEHALYPALCAATALTSLRIIMDEWLDRVTDTSSPVDLREQIDEVIGTLTAGLDWPGTPEA
jgi:AcrR family transcriptional regulator